MDWKFLWVSSFGSEFNYDFSVSFRPADVAAGQAQYSFRPAPEWTTTVQDLSGGSVFYKSETSEIFHTYSSYGRGGEENTANVSIISADVLPHREPLLIFYPSIFVFASARCPRTVCPSLLDAPY
jgi:predicted dithiol-disulfide oxidoreductase (DUF899 family)